MESTFDWNQKRIKGIIDLYGYKFFFNKKIVDLGCGHADLSGVLQRLGADITAVDSRQEHLKIVSKKFPGIKTVKANLEGPWPFPNLKFDIILDLGLICHLSSFEEHLKTVCAATTYLILETAVCDSNDPKKCVQVPEGKDVYDLSYNGMGCRPSTAAIENSLTSCGMSFKRMDSSKLNSHEYSYDWQSINDGSHSIYKRRIWFCTKNVDNTPPGIQPIVVIRPPSNVNFTPSQQSSPVVIGPSPQSNIEQTHNSTNQNSTPPVIHTSPLPRSNTSNIRELSKKYTVIPGESVPQFPNLKVLYLPIGSQIGTVDAWNNIGVELEVYDFHGVWDQTKNKNTVSEEFLNRIKKFGPSLIHMQLQLTGLLDTNIISEARKLSPNVIITNWSGDVRDKAVPNFVNVAKSVDYSFISSTGQLEMYKKAGCSNIGYWQIGYDPKTSHPLNKKEFKYDISFLGNNYGNTFPDGKLRLGAANKLRQVFGKRFGLFGSGYSPPAPMVDPIDANKIYNDSVCALSISNFNNISHYFSDRLLYCLASGRPTISWHFPGIEDYFEEGKEIFIAKSNDDIINIVNHCKNNPDIANQVGMNGYLRAFREHTYTSRIIELLHMINLV